MAQAGWDPATLVGGAVYGIVRAFVSPSAGIPNIRRFLGTVLGGIPDTVSPTLPGTTPKRGFTGPPPVVQPAPVPVPVPSSPPLVPSSPPRPVPSIDPRIISPAVRVLQRVLGLPYLIFYPSRTADDDTVPEDYPYPEPLPQPVPPRGPSRRPRVGTVGDPTPDDYRYPFPGRRFPDEFERPDPLELPTQVPRPDRRPDPTVPTAWPAPSPRPGTRPGRAPQPRPPAWPFFWPRPDVSPPRVPSSPPRRLPRLPDFDPTRPTPSSPPPQPLTPLQPSPLQFAQPLPQPTPAESGRCPPCEQVKRRTRKKGRCRQGYFREYPNRTEYITWSNRRCQ